MVKYNPTGHMIAITAGPGGKDIAIFSTLFHKQVMISMSFISHCNCCKVQQYNIPIESKGPLLEEGSC
jgi:hypothetical protein